MSDQYQFRTEIEQILRKNTRSHFAKRFLGMQKGLTDAEMAEEAVRAGEGVRLERIAYVRETVCMTLDGQLDARLDIEHVDAGVDQVAYGMRRSM
jgi:hypothetical protein